MLSLFSCYFSTAPDSEEPYVKALMNLPYTTRCVVGFFGLSFRISRRNANPYLMSINVLSCATVKTGYGYIPICYHFGQSKHVHQRIWSRLRKCCKHLVYISRQRLLFCPYLNLSIYGVCQTSLLVHVTTVPVCLYCSVRKRDTHHAGA